MFSTIDTNKLTGSRLKDLRRGVDDKDGWYERVWRLNGICASAADDNDDANDDNDLHILPP